MLTAKLSPTRGGMMDSLEPAESFSCHVHHQAIHSEENGVAFQVLPDRDARESTRIDWYHVRADRLVRMHTV